MSVPSLWIARWGFSPARRVATGISCSSNVRGERNRFWYSRNPLLTQSGRRVPAAINRHFIREARRLSGARGALRRRYIPQLLESIELAHARQHDVHDHLAQIDEHPVAVLLSLDAVRAESRLLGPFDHALGNRAHVPVGGSTRDHHEVRNIGDAAHVEHLPFHGLHIAPGINHHGLERRLRLGNSAIVGGFEFAGGLWLAGCLRIDDRCVAVLCFTARGLFLDWHYVLRGLE